MSDLTRMAQDLGRAMARTEEYQAVRRAVSIADDDREIVELTQTLEKLDQRLRSALEQGRQPDQEIQDEYEAAMSRLQASSNYQRLVAAQANFDRVVQRVNQTIAKGLEEGADSRIIIPGAGS